MKLFFSVLSILLISFNGMAAVIQLAVPRSQIQFPSEDLSKKTSPLYFEVGLTTWAPSALRGSSRLANTSEYKSLQNSSLKIEMGKEIYSNDSFSLLGLIGFSHLQLERNGQMSNGSTLSQESEILNLFQVPLSLDFRGAAFLSSKLHPLFKISLSPTYSRSTSGAFTKGVSELNWVGASSLGFSFDLPKKEGSQFLNGWCLASGIEASQSLDASQFEGTGFWIALGLNWN